MPATILLQANEAERKEKTMKSKLIIAAAVTAAISIGSPANAGVDVEEYGWCGVASLLAFSLTPAASIVVGTMCMALASA